jgi:phosphoenolpyruvate carboxylase
VLPRHAVTQAQPYAQAAELRADLDVLYRPLFANGSALIARGRLRRCGARSKCSAFTSRASTCGRTRECTSAPWPSCS